MGSIRGGIQIRESSLQALVPFPPPTLSPQQKPKPRAQELARRLEYAERLRATTESTHDFERDHQQISSPRMKKQYDMRSVACTFHRGILIWLHNPSERKAYLPDRLLWWND